MPVVRTDGGSGGRLVYGHATTKFSRMGRLLHFLTHGAPLVRFARENSAIIGAVTLPIGNGLPHVDSLSLCDRKHETDQNPEQTYPKLSPRGDLWEKSLV